MVPTFLPERDMPDLSCKVLIVTGANSGIGYETVKQRLLKNAKDKGTDAVKSLEAETNTTAYFFSWTSADLTSVRSAAADFLARESRLDILFNNGLASGDLVIGIRTNIIGHFLFTELLLPALAKSRKESHIPARIINTSVGHFDAPDAGIAFATRKGGSERDAMLKTWCTFRAPWQLDLHLIKQAPDGNSWL
ncbi:hypothetical protein FB451DRAFT_1180084 [Mycena latifolia]|nr:hypothetical protein FB451DRAFT_1180084 [Mycena latifolia]